MAECGDRWRYAVLAAKFCMDVLKQGLLSSFGVLLPALTRKLDTNYATVGSILSIELTVYFMACPLVSFLEKWIVPRKICIVGGFGAGTVLILSAFTTSTSLFGVYMFSLGLFTAPVNQISHESLHQYFGERYGHINAMCMMGTFVGGLAFPVLSTKLIEGYGMEGALLCLGALCLNFVPIAATFRPLETHAEGRKGFGTENDRLDTETDLMPDEEFRSDEIQGASVPKLTKRTQQRQYTCGYDLVSFVWETLNLRVLVIERAFSLLFLPCKFILQFILISWYLFVVSFATSKGFDDDRAAYLQLAGALGGFISQGVVIVILHYRQGWGAGVFVAEMTLIIVALFMYPFAESFFYLFACSLLIGAGMYGGFPATYAVLATYVIKENFAFMLSVKLFVTGVAVVAAGYIAGSLYDATGSLDRAFMVLGGMGLLSILLMALLLLIKRCPMPGRSEEGLRGGERQLE